MKKHFDAVLVNLYHIIDGILFNINLKGHADI